MLTFRSQDEFQVIDQKKDGIIAKVRLPFGLVDSHFLYNQEFKFEDRIFVINEVRSGEEGFALFHAEVSFKDQALAELDEELNKTIIKFKDLGTDLAIKAACKTTFLHLLTAIVCPPEERGMMKAVRAPSRLNELAEKLVDRR